MTMAENFTSSSTLASSSSNSTQYGAIVPIDEECDSIQYWEPIKGLNERSQQTTSRASQSCSLTTGTAEDSFYCPDEDRTISDRFFQLMGFSNNPFASGSDIRNNKASDMRLAMLSNFSTAYNVVSISMALDIMKDVYAATPQDTSLCSSALIAGMVAGQLMGGALGDVLGRHIAMTVVMVLQVVGALATSMAFDGYFSIYLFIASWRFVLGLGCGGVYPLAATITAESSNDKEDGSKAVALTFAMQGVGYLASPIVTALLVSTFPSHHGFCWRCLLGLGAAPGLWLMVLRLRNQEKLSKSTSDSDGLREKMVMASAREVPVSVIDAIAVEENLITKLLGTGGCWFLFDVLFYGNVLFQPVVLSAAFGAAETVQKAAIDTSVVSALALPGYFVSVLTMGRQSPRLIQAQGFLMMAILYIFIGVFFHELAQRKVLMIVVYGSTFFFSNYGPNATTYVLPSMTFSRPCRSTLNGFCAACGKAGALMGTMLFVTAASKFGQQTVMLTCGFFSIIGMIFTLLFVSETVCKADDESTDKVPMKIVVSEPSLIDYYESA